MLRLGVFAASNDACYDSRYAAAPSKVPGAFAKLFFRRSFVYICTFASVIWGE